MDRQLKVIPEKPHNQSLHRTANDGGPDGDATRAAGQFNR